jgi:CO/xanthine dehydrogenase FAD-binding subunit
MTNETTAYYRPRTMAELDEILAKFEGKVKFLAGGDYNLAQLEEDAPLVDLQSLGLDQIISEGDKVEIGALSTLEQMKEAFQGWDGLQEALSIEAGLNARTSLSLANFLRTADGRSPFLCALLAFTPSIELLPSHKSLKLENYLTTRQEITNEFISGLSLCLPKSLAFETIARAPKDRPIICMAAAVDKSGGLRIASGGLQAPPQVLSISGDPKSAFALVQQAYQEGSDAWASAEYRQGMSQVLLRRLMQSLGFSV